MPGGAFRPGRGGRHGHRVARPGRRHLHTVRRDDRPVPESVVRRRFADDLAEGAAEGAQAGEADVEADVGDAAVRLAQQEHGAFHPSPLEVPVRRLAEDRSEGADEVRLRDMGDRGDRLDVERLGVGTVHRVAGAEQAPVQVLDIPAHACNATRCGLRARRCARHEAVDEAVSISDRPRRRRLDGSSVRTRRHGVARRRGRRYARQAPFRRHRRARADRYRRPR